MNDRNGKLLPRNGHTPLVGIVARISGCANQKELSLDDQIDHGKQEAARWFQGTIDYNVIATKAKGERLDRPELDEVEKLLRTSTLDLLIVEDLGRLVRGAHALKLCGIAVDHGTRVIAPNDCIDTADRDWENDVWTACREHAGHNAHTSKRLKQKMMNRFEKHGGSTAREIFGYIKPAGAKTYDDWLKDPEATPVIQKWFQILDQTQNCSAVADWLNRDGVPMGKYARSESWNGHMVRRITSNPILKGRARRGERHTVKHHETGRRVSVPNPEGPSFWECPHLAHIDATLFDRVNAKLIEANEGLGRKPVDGHDPLWRVPRKRTRYPGQLALCWYCGRQLVWGGTESKRTLMCKGSGMYKCWNSIAIDGKMAVRKIMEVIAAELDRLEGFDAQFREMVERAMRDGGADCEHERAALHKRQEQLEEQVANVSAAIAQYGPKPMFEQKLMEIETTTRQLAQQQCELESRQNIIPELPKSVAELRLLFKKQFQELAADSPEFGDLLRQLVPEFYAYVVRCCDGGHPLPRAKVKLVLSGLVPNAGHVAEFTGMLTREFTLDLFEPPQRERIRVEAIQLAAEGMEQRQIAKQFPEYVTQTAVYNALNLDQKMRNAGLANPYIVLMEPPADYPKLRRHRNAKYSFEPLEGYQRPLL